MSTNGKALAAAAKERGNALFAQKTSKGYEGALAEYAVAISHDPTDHIFHANSCACHVELAQSAWVPHKKCEAYARALGAARCCTELASEWVKGYVRQASSEFELVRAKSYLEDTKPKKNMGRRSFLAGGESEELGPELATLTASASYSSCEASCRKGLELEPDNAMLRACLQDLRDACHVTEEKKDRLMRNQNAAAPHKAAGNLAFTAKNFSEAASHYTKAMAEDSFDHIFFSNRSACFTEEEEHEKALQDTDRCVALSPEFGKGHSRRALALYNLGRYTEAETSVQAALAIDPDNLNFQDLSRRVQAETAEAPETQRLMHQIREEKRRDEKMKSMWKGLGTSGVQASFDSMLGQFGRKEQGAGKAGMSEDTMRNMARDKASRSWACTFRRGDIPWYRRFVRNMWQGNMWEALFPKPRRKTR